MIFCMKQVNPSDLYEVRPVSLLGGLDLDYLLDLYEPLIGGKALSAYLTLSHEKPGALGKHEDLFLRISLSAGEWFAAVQALEAVGLVRTFTKPGKNCLGFVYALYAPKTPEQFFDNALFAGTLRKTLGADKCQALANKYSVMQIPTDYEECTESFATFFAPDFKDPAYLDGLLKTGGRLSGMAQTGFDRNVFADALHKLNVMFNSLSLSEEELLKIERLATLYSYSEETMAEFVNDNYDFFAKKGLRFNYDGLVAECDKSIPLSYLHKAVKEEKSVLDGNGDMASGIKKMESLSPAEYLTYLQRGNKPAAADLEILRELTIDMGLPNSVANALVLYVLTKNKNILSKKLTEKIGASLVREGVTTALDALNYLTYTTTNKKPQTNLATAKATTAPKKEEETPTKMSDEDFQKLVKGLYDKK
jgi:replication initiation and membrane attachment protein